MVGECRADRGRAGGREVEEESAGRWKKWGKIMQQCLILCNRKWAKGRKPKKKWGGSRKYKVWEARDLDPLPPYPLNILSTKLFADVDALKCYVCTETGDDACSKSKLAGDQATYSRDCGDFLDRCFRQEAKVLGLKTVSTFCATEITCKSLQNTCNKFDGCKDATCCDNDNCNGGSAVYFSMFLMTVCCVFGLVLK